MLPDGVGPLTSPNATAGLSCAKQSSLSSRRLRPERHHWGAHGAVERRLQGRGLGASSFVSSLGSRAMAVTRSSDIAQLGGGAPSPDTHTRTRP